MDFEKDNFGGQPIQPTEQSCGEGQNVAGAAPVKKRSGWKIFWGVITGLSVLANIVLFFVLIIMVAMFTSTPRVKLFEEVLRDSRRADKIAVINLRGVIDDEQYEEVHRQIDAARRDRHVRGLILRVNSPGGTISASDQIHNEILKYREDTNMPVVAFMQGIAASGGYYTSVACEEIIAEPTTITGSVGVIMSYLVVQELLEGKLGIQPVVVKSGLRKDWPSPFQPPSPEQLEYLDNKLIKPAYERFVKIVADGREPLTLDEVRRLADGSIYGAEEALNERLIDEIGYLDSAIVRVLMLAGIEDARVVEYRKPTTLMSLLRGQSQNILSIDRNKLYELSTPQALYLWSGY